MAGPAAVFGTPLVCLSATPNTQPTRPQTRSFRGEQFYDGSFNGNGQGWLPCPPVGHCIRISSMPAGLKLGELLRSSLGYEQKIRTASLLATALPNVPAASISMAAAYTTNGGAFQADAAAAGSFFSALQQLVTPGEGEADVFPGRRHPLPTNAFIWASYLLSAAVNCKRDGSAHSRAVERELILATTGLDAVFLFAAAPSRFGVYLHGFTRLATNPMPNRTPGKTWPSTSWVKRRPGPGPRKTALCRLARP
jgi:hypothetical protein